MMDANCGMFWDDPEDSDDYDIYDNLDDDLGDGSLYDYAGSDTADDFFDERDEMREYLDEGETVDDEPENDDADDQSHMGSNENVSRADDSDPGEDCDGSDIYSQGVAESIDDDNDDAFLEERSASPQEDVAVQVSMEGGEIEESNQDEQADSQSEGSSGSTESEQEVYADAENGNYATAGPPDYFDDMMDYYDDDGEDDLWDDDMSGGPWEDDMWDDAGAVDDWYDYYYGEDVWDEDTNNGRFELRYEDYGGEAIPGEDGMGEARDPTARDNFVTHTTAVDPTEGGNTTEDPGVADNKHGAEGANHSCPICLDKLDTQEVGSPWNCQHYFCINCILQWVHRNNTCPVDRDVICKIAVRCKVGSPVTRVVWVRPLEQVAEEA